MSESVFGQWLSFKRKAIPYFRWTNHRKRMALLDGILSKHLFIERLSQYRLGFSESFSVWKTWEEKVNECCESVTKECRRVVAAPTEDGLVNSCSCDWGDEDEVRFRETMIYVEELLLWNGQNFCEGQVNWNQLIGSEIVSRSLHLLAAFWFLSALVSHFTRLLKGVFTTYNYYDCVRFIGLTWSLYCFFFNRNHEMESESINFTVCRTFSCLLVACRPLTLH